ncbi:uncharacterized protein LOC132611847 [Lycium barbarum]|uniref:uncharacterized protein LOC132611847 n=1 Tax=Lycium barbarum TaxID=112863 RepID=UPI00293E9AC2|nr:uncharacterized protein LOC132611847 [Lycium barbarum]
MGDIQHVIDFIPGSIISNKPAYRMSPKEHEELQRQVKQLFEKGLVSESVSICAIPALLVPKKDGTWRMCIDSCDVNKITIMEPQSFPRLTSRVDIIKSLCVREMNGRLHSRLVMGYIVSSQGIEVDQGKVEAIINWHIPNTLHDVRNFHGLASFYRRFIRNFSSIAAPLTKCLKRESFTWNTKAHRSFEEMKGRITRAPILALPNSDQYLKLIVILLMWVLVLFFLKKVGQLPFSVKTQQFKVEIFNL